MVLLSDGMASLDFYDFSYFLVIVMIIFAFDYHHEPFNRARIHERKVIYHKNTGASSSSMIKDK